MVFFKKKKVEINTDEEGNFILPDGRTILKEVPKVSATDVQTKKLEMPMEIGIPNGNEQKEVQKEEPVSPEVKKAMEFISPKLEYFGKIYADLFYRNNQQDLLFAIFSELLEIKEILKEK